MQTAEAIFFASVLTLVVILLAHGIRMLIHLALRTVGLWNPEHFRYWIWIPWRSLAKLYIRYGEWRTDEWKAGSKATSQWGGLLGRMVLVFKPGDVLLGGFGYYGFRLFQPLGLKAERHLSMVAGTGTGKTTLLITMLGLHRGNAFVVDPKGQITKIIANRRGMGGNGIKGVGQDVAILDPNNIAKGHPLACWNAIDELTRVEARVGSDAVVRYAMKIAEGLIPMEGDKPYFPNTAREFTQGLILHVYTTEPPGKRHMVRVRDLLTRGYANEMMAAGATPDEVSANSFKFLLEEMQKNLSYNGVIANAAATMANTGKSYGDVLSTARSALKFYDLPEIRKISYSSDFSLEDLKLGKLDLFICAPTGDIRGAYRGWFRLLCVFALDLFEQIPGNLKNPCLFAIDEMPSLGPIEAIATSAPVMRGYGVRLLAITQDLEKLQKTYPSDWRGFLGNSDVTYWMGTNEQDTGKHLSEYLGKSTRVTHQYSILRFWRWWRLFWARGEKTFEDRELLTPQQVMKILAPQKQNMILTRFGKSPIRVKTMPYFKELPVYFYDADGEHTEPSARQFGRYLSGRRTKKAISPTQPNLWQQPKIQPPQKTALGTQISRKTLVQHQQPQSKIVNIPNSQNTDLDNAYKLIGLRPSSTRYEIEKRMNFLKSKSAPSTMYSKKIDSAYKLIIKYK